MSRHTEQTSKKLDTYSEELQLAVLTQQNKRRIQEILPFKITISTPRWIKFTSNYSKKTEIPLH